MSNIPNYPSLRPAILLDFLNGSAIDPRISVTRASVAQRWTSAGVLTSSPSGVARLENDAVLRNRLGLLIEGNKTNMVPRSMTTGAALGVVGSGGAVPTTWASTPKATSGLDTEIVGLGTENGLPYVDVRMYGTPIAGNQGIVFGNVSGFAASTEYSGSVYAKLIAGSAGGAGSVQLQARYNTASGSTNISSNFTPANLNGDLRSQRLITNGSTDGAATGSGSLLLVFNLTNGTAYDFTMRLSAPQLEAGTATSVIFTDGAAATRAAEVATLDLPTYGDITVLTEYQHGAKLRNTRALGLYSPTGSGSVAVIAGNSAGTSSAGVIASPAGPNSTVPGLAPVAGRIDRVAFSRGFSGAMLLAARGAALVAGNHTGATAAMQTICLGNSTGTGTSHLDGYIRRVAVWFRSLNQAELNKITEG